MPLQVIIPSQTALKPFWDVANTPTALTRKHPEPWETFSRDTQRPRADFISLPSTDVRWTSVFSSTGSPHVERAGDLACFSPYTSPGAGTRRQDKLEESVPIVSRHEQSCSSGW